MGLLTQNDVRIYRNWFKECAYLRGQTVLYRYPMKIDTTIHAEMLTEMSDPIEMDIIFEENPKNATLKAIKWVSEFPDDKPYIAYLPWDAPEISTECTIEISPVDSLNETGRLFKITSIHSLLEYPDCWTCTVAPIFDTETPNNNYSDTNYNKIKTNEDQPEDDSPNNKNYSFLNINE